MRKKPQKRTAKRPVTRKEAIRRDSEWALDEMIRGLLGLPMNKRVWFLRVRHPNGGSHV